MFNPFRKKIDPVAVEPVAVAKPQEPVPVILSKYPPVVVAIPEAFGGGLGVIHHFKVDGRFGVRPVDSNGNLYANKSEHWTAEQRLTIPHEISLSYDQLKAVVETPEWAK